MDAQTKNVIRIFSYYTLITTIIFFIEVSQVEQELLLYFVLVKFVGIATVLWPILRLYRRGRYDAFSYTLLCISIASYPPLGQLFRPTYEYSLLPIYLIFAMFVPLKRIVILSVQVGGTLAFCVVYYLTFERNIKLAAQMNVFDNIFSYLVFGFTAAYVSHVLAFEKSLRMQAQTRFLLIGRHAATIVHDLKNMIGLPRLQIDNLKQKINQEYDTSNLSGETRNVLLAQADEIESSIEQTAQAAFRFNQMVVLSNDQKTEVAVTELLQEVMSLLRRQLQSVRVDVSGDRIVNADRGLALSLFLNLFLNSIEALSLETEKYIQIVIDQKKISFKDNGSGFAPGVIESFYKMKSISSKKYGNGFGLLIIKEASEELGASAKFYNLPEGGACVELSW